MCAPGSPAGKIVGRQEGGHMGPPLRLHLLAENDYTLTDPKV